MATNIVVTIHKIQVSEAQTQHLAIMKEY